MPRPAPKAFVIFLLTAGIGLGLDLFTKVVSFKHLAETITTTPSGRVIVLSDVYKFVPGWLHFEVTANQGAVFGLGQGRRWVFILVSVAAIGFLGGLFLRSGGRTLYQFILALLLAGVIGNMYDRVMYGYVRDMIHALPDQTLFGRPAFPWIFNLADSYLCVGVFLMFIYSFFQRPEPHLAPAQQPQPTQE